MRRKTYLRRQHVHLRGKHRVVLVRRLGLVLAAGFAIVIISQVSRMVAGPHESVLSRFILQHTPKVNVSAPAELAGLPLARDIPRSRFWLWFPGWEWRLRDRWMREYPAIRNVSLDKHFTGNQIEVRLEPRTPIVSCQGGAMDGDGVIFPIDPARAAGLRTASFSGKDAPAALGRWITALSHAPSFWYNVVAIAQDSLGNMTMELRTGTHVVWGPLDTIGTAQKALALCRVLDDAHQRLGGASLADARFFSEGRIIIRPKSVT